MQALRQEFPDLVEELDEDDGLVYLQTGTLARHTRHLIDSGARQEVAGVFEFARRWWIEGDDEVQNALGVAFVEHLNFHDGKAARRWAFDLLPAPLREAAVALARTFQ